MTQDTMLIVAMFFVFGFIIGYGVRDTRRWRYDRKMARRRRWLKMYGDTL